MSTSIRRVERFELNFCAIRFGFVRLMIYLLLFLFLMLFVIIVHSKRANALIVWTPNEILKTTDITTL